MRSTTAHGAMGTSTRSFAKRRAYVVAARWAVCWRCGRPIHPNELWDVGHSDDRRRWKRAGTLLLQPERRWEEGASSRSRCGRPARTSRPSIPASRPTRTVVASPRAPTRVRSRAWHPEAKPVRVEAELRGRDLVSHAGDASRSLNPPDRAGPNEPMQD